MAIYFQEPPRWVETIGIVVIILSMVFLAFVVPLVLLLLEKGVIG